MASFPILDDPPVSSLTNRVSVFVDREEEQNVLDRELIQLQTRVVIIVGPAGFGKTFLAFEFARRNHEYFSGGVFDIHPTPMPSLSEMAFNKITDANKESLLIINNAERLPGSVVETELEYILHDRPKARIILTSRRQMQFRSMNVISLALTPFTQDVFTEYLRRVLRSELAPPVQKELFERLQGHPLSIAIATVAMRDGLYNAPELLKSLEPFIREGLLGPNGRPLKPENKSYNQIISDIRDVSDELLKILTNEPKLLYELSPRLFEQVVAEMLSRLGYEVTLTPASRDGGKDIYAASRNHLGSFLYIVECKKYAPDNLVGVALVRQLYGVVQAEKATAGILATTSFFTKDAKEFQGQVEFQISLQDYLGIQKWLQSVQH